MLLALGKTIFAGIVISFCSWFSGKRPELAGFIAALPLTTLLILAFSYFEWNDTATTVRFAKNIFVALPITLLFFIPFLLAEKFQLGFWSCYSFGLLLLGGGVFYFSTNSKICLVALVRCAFVACGNGCKNTKV